MRHYDHRMHAGNAGDVWKHFLLLEAADCLLTPDSSLVYAESHAGRHEYSLKASGDWEGGIGKIWPFLPSLKNFSYFDILADLNPKTSPSDLQDLLYPGSARLIYELAKRRGAKLEADIWDNDAAVARSWEGFSKAAKPAGSSPPKSSLPAEIVFHQGDGFAGVLSRLNRFPAGLLFIDPPYINPEDVRLARKLLDRAIERGWIVLWWYMTEMDTAPDGLQAFELQFSEAGLDGGRWKGAGVAYAGTEGEKSSHLASHMNRQIEKFIRILKSELS
jgi:23S rRNA (adenine2030-N6)-methyltransferase